jgi:hypothetical protein
MKLMIDEAAVKFAIEYLDRQFVAGETADLVGMLNHVDYFDRIVMVLEEVNETLRQRPTVFAQRIDGRVVFSQSSGDREITAEDLDINIRLYHRWFQETYKRLADRQK